MLIVSMMITDEEILVLMQKGLLYVEFPSLTVFKFHGGRGRFVAKTPREHPKSGRITYNIRIKQRYRTIYRNKLVWMVVHERVVPNGRFVDHIDGDRLNDQPENLQLQTEGESHAQGFGRQQDKAMQEWDDFWNYIEFMGPLPWV